MMKKFGYMDAHFACLIALVFCASLDAFAQQQRFREVSRFPAEEVRQGVAVDAGFVYVVDSRAIGKYEKESGRRVARWEEEEDGPIIHLNSGVVIDGTLYAAHSNYSDIPMTSSIEMWDTETLEHINSYSLGIRWGSLTWLDRHDGFWWAVFAHYERFVEEIGKGNRWTTLVQFDDRWQPLESWVFPPEVLERFAPKSNSGGAWGPDGRLYATGHDRPEVYVLSLPDAGSELVFEATIPVDNEGQGIAWDRTDPEAPVLYTIVESTREVVAFEMGGSGFDGSE